VEWSRKNSERLQKSIRHEVQKQMAKTGVATKDEVEALKRRIRELESQAKLQAKSQAKTSAKAPAVRRATTPRSAGTGIAKAPATSGTTGSRKSQTSGATRIPKGGTARRTPPAGTRGG
jgi:hypothetical protein